MSAGARIAVGVVKWLVLPAGLGAIGYYVVGPRIGAVPELANQINRVVKPKTQEKVEEPKKKLTPPDIEVNVEPKGRSIRERDPADAIYRANKSKKKKPAEPKPAEDEPAPDPGPTAPAPATEPDTDGG